MVGVSGILWLRFQNLSMILQKGRGRNTSMQIAIRNLSSQAKQSLSVTWWSMRVVLSLCRFFVSSLSFLSFYFVRG